MFSMSHISGTHVKEIRRFDHQIYSDDDQNRSDGQIEADLSDTTVRI